MAVHIRLGTPEDIKTLVALDDVARRDLRRVRHITQAVQAGSCFVAEREGKPVGYVVLTYSFYDNGMIELLIVDGHYRRCGIGSALMAYAENLCRTPKLFTSTNLSNKAMQLLLEKSGWRPSGYIDNLDPGDPELVYFKQLSKG